MIGSRGGVAGHLTKHGILLEGCWWGVGWFFGVEVIFVVISNWAHCHRISRQNEEHQNGYGSYGNIDDVKY